MTTNMTEREFFDLVGRIFPNAAIEEGIDAGLVIHTNLWVANDGLIRDLNTEEPFTAPIASTE